MKLVKSFYQLTDLHSYSSKDSVKRCRSMEQSRKPRNRPTQIYLIEFGHKFKEIQCRKDTPFSKWMCKKNYVRND